MSITAQKTEDIIDIGEFQKTLDKQVSMMRTYRKFQQNEDDRKKVEEILNHLNQVEYLFKMVKKIHINPEVSCSKSCSEKSVLKEMNTVTQDILKALDIAKKSKNLDTFLKDIKNKTKEFHNPSLLHRGRIEKFYTHNSEIEHKLSELTKENEKEFTINQKLLTYISEI